VHAWKGTEVFWLCIGCVLLGWGLHQYWVQFYKWRARRRLAKMILANMDNIQRHMAGTFNQLLKHEAKQSARVKRLLDTLEHPDGPTH
jgi:predicted component of type VI protein secretion system